MQQSGDSSPGCLLQQVVFNSTDGSLYTLAGHLYPTSNNTYTLGSQGNTWSQVWSTNGMNSTSDSAMKVTVPLQYGLSDMLGVDTIKYKWKTLPENPAGRRP